MDEYTKVCTKYNRLCTERSHSSFWADNIIQATNGITQPIVWQNFYSYMGNAQHEFSAKWQDSLGEQIDNGLKYKDGDVVFKTKTVQNGNVTYIRMTPVPPEENLSVLIKKGNGESVDNIPKAIHEEASGDVVEDSDEKRER